MCRRPGVPPITQTIANLEFSMKVMKAMTAGAKNFPKRSVNVTK